jgi:hypothetical protein
MKNINIWISSIIESNIALDYLKECILSCINLKNNFTIYLSIYLSDNIDKTYFEHKIEKILEESTKKYKIIIRNDKLQQFEHIKKLTDEYSNIIDNDEWIIFMDDDDMLLQCALDYLDDTNIEFDGYIGLQYIGEHKMINFETMENLKYNELDNFMEKYSKIMEIDTDFSGTAILFGSLKKYFNTKSYITPYVEDCVFMKYIEEKLKTIALDSPIVYHRVKSTSSWKENLTKYLIDLINKKDCII